MSSTDAMQVKQCLGALDRTERYVVLMYFADELTPAEIGLVLDVSLARVMAILDQFRQKLAGLFARREPQRQAQQFVSDWLGSSGSAVV